MCKPELRGCGTALLTPFKNGEVDFEAYEALVKRQVESGVDFLVPLGTTAETPTLSAEEKVALMKITRKVAGDLPLIVGAGTNSLSGTLANMELVQEWADAFLVVTPYYNKPTQKGLFEYYTAVAAASSKPIVLYNVPGRTGVNLEASTTLALAQNPKIIAVKEASGKYAQISQVIAGAPAGFKVFSGNDDETLSLMATGADGVISVVSNVAPVQMSALAHALMAGDLDQARSLHHALFPLCKACFVESNPIPGKAALSLLGLCSGEMRLPLTSASESTVALMKEVLGDLQKRFTL